MTGDERVRFCKQCKLNVYNIDEMSDRKAIDLIQSNEKDSLCIRLYRRWDGKIITNNCPVGLRWTKRILKYAAIFVFALAAWLSLIDEVSAQGIVGGGNVGRLGQSNDIGLLEAEEDYRGLIYGATIFVALSIYIKIKSKNKKSLVILSLFMMVFFVIVGMLSAGLNLENTWRYGL